MGLVAGNDCPIAGAAAQAKTSQCRRAAGPKRFRETRPQAFDREDREDVGRRPLLSLLPLGLARRTRRDGSGRGE